MGEFKDSYGILTLAANTETSDKNIEPFEIDDFLGELELVLRNAHNRFLANYD